MGENSTNGKLCGVGAVKNFTYVRMKERRGNIKIELFRVINVLGLAIYFMTNIISVFSVFRGG